MPVTEIEFNADMGEGLGVWPAPLQVWRFDLDRDGPIDPEAAAGNNLVSVMRMVSTVNLACGFHAGDALHCTSTSPARESSTHASPVTCRPVSTRSFADPTVTIAAV